jgi:hypothetical protein
LCSWYFSLSSVGWRRERALLMQLIELLHELLEASGSNLLKSLLEGISFDAFRDVKLSFKIVLKLIEPIGFLIG